VSFVDVRQCGLDAQEPERRSERRVVRDGDAVLTGTEPERQPERRQPLVDGVGEEVGDEDLLAGDQN
jgi:hypothetical protein